MKSVRRFNLKDFIAEGAFKNSHSDTLQLIIERAALKKLAIQRGKSKEDLISLRRIQSSIGS
jgi:hypothetical protein